MNNELLPLLDNYFVTLNSRIFSKISCSDATDAKLYVSLIEKFQNQMTEVIEYFRADIGPKLQKQILSIIQTYVLKRYTQVISTSTGTRVFIKISHNPCLHRKMVSH